eukprot:743141-Rhodomonas_salina.4
MSGTDVAHRAICLCACYAMSGSHVAYAATRTMYGSIRKFSTSGAGKVLRGVSYAIARLGTSLRAYYAVPVVLIACRVVSAYVLCNFGY